MDVCAPDADAPSRSVVALDDDPLERRPADIRPPKTFAEAGAALELIDETLDALEVAVDTRRHEGRDPAVLIGLTRRWLARRAQIQYDHERFAADDPRANVKLHAKYAALSGEVEGLRRNLAAAREELAQYVVEPEGSRAKQSRMMQEMLATLSYAVGEMVAAGAALTPLAAQALQQARANVSPKVLDVWRAEVLPRKHAGALERAARNAVTSSSPPTLEDIERTLSAWADEMLRERGKAP